MNQTPAQQWTVLSALYEEADELSPAELVDWLARLRLENHPMLPQLQRMLEARAQVETDDFLGTLPKFVPPPSQVPTEPFWATGSRVGPYRLVRPLGEGGMAEVWLADRDDGAFTRRVAVKLPFPRPGREGLAARFDRERDILASLRHPHIAGLLDAGVTAQGQAWLALEYVEGEPLSVYCDRRQLSVRQRVELFRQVLLAVQHAHANLVIHRDLKPGNILVTAQGEARLLDFGIAKLMEAEGSAIAETELTRVAGRSLTPRYASPEQLTGRPLTIACDVYALGVVLYELLCGERPYELRSESAAQLEQAILEAEPRAPSRRVGNEGLAADRGTTSRQLRRTLSPELDAIVLRCLRKSVAQRFSSVDALLADVDRWLAGEAVLARAPGPWYRFAKFALRHRLGMALGATGLVALVGMTTVATIFGVHAREESARAVASRDFMLQLFRGAEREKAHGADITARELLQSGRRDVLGQLSAEPRLQVELLSGIASIQSDMGEFVSADRTWEDVLDLAARSGQSERRALALANQADGAVHLGSLSRAGELIDRAKAALRAGDDKAASKISIVEGWLAAFTGRPEEARRSFQNARDIGANDYTKPDVLEALRGAIYVAKVQLRYDEALTKQNELERIVRSQPHAKPRELASLAYRRFDLVYSAGRYAEVASAVPQATSDCAASLGANDELCRRMALIMLRARMRLGYADADARTMELAESMSSDEQTPVARATASYMLLRMESVRGSTPRLALLDQRVTAWLDAKSNAMSEALNPSDRLLLGVGLAYASLAVGDFGSASRRADRAQEAWNHAGNVGHSAALLVEIRLIKAIAARMDGRPDEAERGIVDAGRDICRLVGSTHPTCRMVEINRAVALADLGRPADAIAIIERERPALDSSFGLDSPQHAKLMALENVLSARLKSTAPPDKLPYVFF